MSNLIEISSGPFCARLLSKGATLSRFQHHGRDLILGFHDPNDHQKIPIYAGAIVGPIANRVSGGSVKIGSNSFQMQRNENGVTTLHSGDHGLHALDWHVIEQHQNRVVFECTLNAGACGLPGNRIISAEYSLDQDGLQLKITATTDAQTPINIAHHPYWVLGDDLAKMRIKIAAQHYLPVGPDNLPLGTVNPVADTTFDFQNLRQIGPASALDHNFCLNQTSRNAPSFAARLSAPDGLTLDVETTEPGLQVYAGSSLPNLPKTATFGTQSRPNAAIALEPQGWPNAPNNNNFPNVFIDENDVYQQVTRYRIYQAN